MSVKGETTEVERKPTTRSATNESDAGGPSSGSGRWIARSGRRAVNAMERKICGDAAVHSVAMAEGLALAGRRAAKLLDRSPHASGPAESMAGAAWVEHRLRWRADQPSRDASFELIAGDVQQAVDHCLVAHRIAAKLGLPVACTLDQELADSLALVRLPEPLPLRDAEPREGGPATVLEVADEAFEYVSNATGRPTRAIELHQMKDARVALVATGAAAARAVGLANDLRAAGVACGAVLPALLRPCPTDRLADAVRGCDVVVLLESVCSPAAEMNWTTQLQRTLGTEAQVRLQAIRPDGAEADWRSEACQALGVETPSAPSNETHEPPVNLGLAPAGAWSEEFLLDAVTQIADLGPWQISQPRSALRGLTILTVGHRASSPSDDPQLDVLLVAAPGQLRNDALAAVRDAGSLLFYGHGSPDDTWSSMAKSLRSQIVERKLHLRWIDLAQTVTDPIDDPAALRTLLHGALLGDEKLAARLEVDPDRLKQTTEAEHDWFVEGARIVRDLDPQQLEQAAGAAENLFGSGRGVPQMPEKVQAEEAGSSWAERLREFHMTGRGAHSAAEPLPALPLAPIAAGRLDESGPDWRSYPLIVDDGPQAAEPGSSTTLLKQVEEALEELERSGEAATLLAEHPGRFVGSAGAILRDRPGPMPLESLLEKTIERTTKRFDLSSAGAEMLGQELPRLAQLLPHSGFAVGLDEQTFTTLYATALRREREPRRTAFRTEIEALILQLQDLLRIDDDHSPEGSSSETLSASLGSSAALFIDPDALAGTLPGHRGSKRLTTTRRERIENTLTILGEYVENDVSAPEIVVVHSGPVPKEWDRAPVRLVEHPDGLEAALGLLAGLAQSKVDLFRAVRTARLEARSAFDEARHGRVLARLDWEAFTAEEYFLLPAVVVLESCKHLRGRGIHSLSKLLRSGLPVHVLVADSVVDLELDASWEETTGYHPGLGYVAVAHREAFVLQSTLAEPAHLFDGLTRMAATLRPGVALVAHPSWSGPVSPWKQLVAARDGRATPCFLYDPDGGTNWAERFDLTGNPDSEHVWPEARTTYLDEKQEERNWIQPFTFAHAAALDPAYRPHFRIIPPEAWSDDQIEIERYLNSDTAVRAVPYLWVVDSDGILARAVTTRELAFACRDRMRAWQILQELAGTNNEYARRAAETARLETLDAARKSREELEAAHAEELAGVRADAAGEAMERLVGVLMDTDSLPAAQPGAQPATPPPTVEMPAAADAVEEAPVEEPPAEEAISFDEAFIDSPLCTTCQECINLNPKMFKYDGNKQAFISDITAGTFEQLVKAAEKCTARCIHPGVPRADDSSATDELIARAAKFN